MFTEKKNFKNANYYTNLNSTYIKKKSKKKFYTTSIT